LSSTSRTPGREALLDAAALLMDEHGIDHASLNEINRASGQRNRSAVQYHFGSRDALVRELFTRANDTIDAERNALLDHLESTGGPLSERAAIEVVVGPLSRRLRTPEGRRYLRLCGQLLNHPRYNADARDTLQMNTSIIRCAQYIGPALAHLPQAIAIERASQVAAFTVRALADQARLADTDPLPRPVLTTEAFVTNLVDILLAMLTAPTTTNSHHAQDAR
jgi:AcrR family transcriptional regulator